MDLKSRKRESGTEIGHSLEFDFVVPPQPLRLARQSKVNWEARTFVPASFLNPFLTRPIFLYFLVDKLEEALYTDSAGCFLVELD